MTAIAGHVIDWLGSGSRVYLCTVIPRRGWRSWFPRWFARRWIVQADTHDRAVAVATTYFSHFADIAIAPVIRQH